MLKFALCKKNITQQLNIMSNFNISCCFIAILVASILEGIAQVRGVVVNKDEEPIEGIAVVALQVADSTYIGGTITDRSGEFAISSANLPSQVILRFEGIGYNKTDILTRSADRVKVVLEESEISLGEVTVTPPFFASLPRQVHILPRRHRGKHQQWLHIARICAFSPS